jgi:hypothetical protein
MKNVLIFYVHLINFGRKKMINIINIQNIKNILDKEFNNSLKDSSNTWEFNQLCLLIGTSKLLIETLNNPKLLIRANKNYRSLNESRK